MPGGVIQFVTFHAEPSDVLQLRDALAEYASAAEDKLASKPTSLTLEQSAAVAVSGVTAGPVDRR